MEVEKDGRRWRIGSRADVDWLPVDPGAGNTIATAIPPVFDAYATCYAPEQKVAEHERALVQALTAYEAEQPWWLGFLETGAYDVVFPEARRVTLYWGWEYVLVAAGPQEALTWRTGRMLYGETGVLPDLFFPADRSWLVSALWDDAWTCVGGPDALVDRLERDPLVNARRVTLQEDMLPPGLTRE